MVWLSGKVSTRGVRVANGNAEEVDVNEKKNLNEQLTTLYKGERDFITEARSSDHAALDKISTEFNLEAQGAVPLLLNGAFQDYDVSDISVTYSDDDFALWNDGSGQNVELTEELLEKIASGAISDAVLTIENTEVTIKEGRVIDVKDGMEDRIPEAVLQSTAELSEKMGIALTVVPYYEDNVQDTVSAAGYPIGMAEEDIGPSEPKYIIIDDRGEIVVLQNEEGQFQDTAKIDLSKAVFPNTTDPDTAREIITSGEGPQPEIMNPDSGTYELENVPESAPTPDPIEILEKVERAISQWDTPQLMEQLGTSGQHADLLDVLQQSISNGEIHPDLLEKIDNFFDTIQQKLQDNPNRVFEMNGDGKYELSTQDVSDKFERQQQDVDDLTRDIRSDSNCIDQNNDQEMSIEQGEQQYTNCWGKGPDLLQP